MNAFPCGTGLGSSVVHTYLRDWEGLETQNKEIEIEWNWYRAKMEAKMRLITLS